jgi:WD40 repeat protein
LVGSDKSLNIGKKIRLQLYYSQRQYRYNMIDSLVPEIYNLYKTGPRVKYPSSLHVTIKPIHPAKQFYLGIGSSYMINEEELNESNVRGSESSRGGVNENDPNKDENRAESLLANELPEDQKNRLMKKKTIIWSRLPGQACNVPNELALSLNSTKQGCYSVKFSTSGSYLACACVEEDNGYPILVFDIPDGKSFAKFYGHFGIVYEIAWSNLDRYILTASHDATVRSVTHSADFRKIKKLEKNLKSNNLFI